MIPTTYQKEWHDPNEDIGYLGVEVCDILVHREYE